MSFKRLVTPSAKRFLKKLPTEAREALVDGTKILDENPYAGEKLSGSLHFLYSFHFKFRSVEYRIAYTIDNEKRAVIIHLVHTRENFYDKLRRLFK